MRFPDTVDRINEEEADGGGGSGGGRRRRRWRERMMWLAAAAESLYDGSWTDGLSYERH